MEKQKFTQEQILLLKENPYTKAATPSQIRFTDEFKNEFWQACLQGKTPEEIFEDKGYDLNLIGEKRIQNTLYLITRSKQQKGEEDSGKRIQWLENEVGRLTFELDALKKLLHWATQGGRRADDQYSRQQVSAYSFPPAESPKLFQRL